VTGPSAYEPNPYGVPAYGKQPKHVGGLHRMPSRPPQPPLDRWFTSEQAMGLGASILIGLVTVTNWATAWSDWHSYEVFRTYRDDQGNLDQGKLDQANLISGSFGIIAALALFAAASVFIVWLWRVRWNAEMFCRGEHRFTRGWVLGSWIVPVVNLWYPKWVVDDIVAASDPRTPPQTVNLRTVPGTPLVWAWWITWVVGLVLGNVAQRSVLDGAPQLHELRTNAALSSISAVSTTAAAVLVVVLVQRVNDLQTQRPWTPWWALDQAQPPFGPPAL
jgi:hypothetical protein